MGGEYLIINLYIYLIVGIHSISGVYIHSIDKVYIHFYYYSLSTFSIRETVLVT